jgi:heat shock protein HslJ
MKKMILLAALQILLLGGCSTVGVGKDSGPAIITSQNVGRIQNLQWELKSLTLDGQKVVMDLDANMTVNFGADGKVTGFGSVNQYSGAYSFDQGGKLLWGNRGFVTTRRSGLPELMQKERIYLEALGKTSRALVNRHTLQLQSDDGSTVLPFDEAGH